MGSCIVLCCIVAAEWLDTSGGYALAYCFELYRRATEAPLVSVMCRGGDVISCW